MAEIPLTQGQVALIDDADLPLVAGYSWHVQKNRRGWYAQAYVPGSRRQYGRSKSIFMHKLLVPGVPQVDHENGNGLDNRRSTNLRPATSSQNGANRAKFPGHSSRYKGVSTHTRGGKPWRAGIKLNGQNRYLGSFHSEEEAALAYNEAARELFGEYARLNVVIQ